MAITLALSACSGSQPEATLENITLGPPEQRGVSLVLSTPTGQHVDIADHRGIAVLVVAFSTDVLMCQALLRNVETVARAHPQDLAAIAIAGDTAPLPELNAMLHTYAEVVGLRSTVVTLATDAVREGDSPLGQIEHVPAVYLINRMGVVSRKVEGYLSVQQIETLVAPALPPR